ncbi:MAG: CBS domain-containing protein [Bdellovibrionota bacterium]
MPKIEKYMSTSPHVVNKEVSIHEALARMRQYQIRHLPVMDQGRLIGLLSDRDVEVATSIEGTWDFRCEDIMTPDTYAVSPQTPLDDVVRQMAQKHLGSAIVQEESGKIVGIFTTVDALLALDEVLRGHYRIKVA